VLIDSHCHLYMSEFDTDRPEVLDRARAGGLEAFVSVGYDLESSRAAIALAEREKDVYACVAIHPHHAAGATDEALVELKRLVSHPKVVGIGEIGLDYYRNLAPRGIQETAFRAQLRLAESLDLPVAIHDREAHADTMRILGEAVRGLPAVILHCFSGNDAMADEAWRRGYYTAIGGPITYRNADELRTVFQRAPRGRVLVETDAPYLPPAPHRGKRNEPAFLGLVVERLASLWGVAPDVAADWTARNACRAFRRSLTGDRG
jgi:TatD DNase family protein